MLSVIVDKSYAPGVIMLSMIVIHNVAVLGLFALENITMAEMFGSRNRFTRMAISRRVVWWRLVSARYWRGSSAIWRGSCGRLSQCW
jgi:hypothetical protein